LRFTVLGSGSSGNATLVAAGSTRVLVDAGFSGRELSRRLSARDTDPCDLDAILITHEHADHVRGAGVMARAHGTPVLMTAGTRRACKDLFKGTEEIREYRPGLPFAVGDLLVEPFATVHDAADPAAFTVVDRTNGARLGVATDLGRPTAHVKHVLRGCDALIIESNHDKVLLSNAGYPAPVRSRIASSHGHLSNEAAAAFVCELFSPRLGAVVLVHLSERSNTPGLARATMEKSLRKKGYRGLVEVARANEPTEWFDIVPVRNRSRPARQLSLF